MTGAIYPFFECHDLANGCKLFTGRLPDDLIWTQEQFEAMWAARPSVRDEIRMYGDDVQIPRLQQAFEKPYQFSGKVKVPEALTPEQLVALLKWAQLNVFAGLNGILNNYYEGPHEYIGHHRDSIANLVKDSPIMTISFGETRIFRLTRRERQSGKSVVVETRDFEATHGGIFVMPFLTNRSWYHEVPKSAKYTGRRISVTMRAFAVDGDAKG